LANSTVGIAHALGNAMGSLCRAPRVNCLAIMLPYSLEYNMSKNGRLIAELLLPLAGTHAFAETPKHLRAERVVAVIRGFNQRLHDLTGGRHPLCLNELKELSGRLLIPETSLEKIAQSARNTVAIFGNPQEMDANDALSVLHRAWEGFPLNSAHPSAGGSSPGFSANDGK
jgi:alcohol dehydrogenase